jgi:bifunctional non-homologous end joining protein LigD
VVIKKCLVKRRGIVLKQEKDIIKEMKDTLVFVIHKHDTVRKHYDLRLEIGGVMPSWAVPKGPTLDNTQKRLAMKTTDHDMSYRNFEGELPEGSYGAGPVIIWDEGTYTPEIEVSKGVREKIEDVREGEKVMQQGLEDGQLKFTLQGKKLKGSFALVKAGFAGKNSWLLIKHKDAYVKEGYDANDDPKSVRSGKTSNEGGE